MNNTYIIAEIGINHNGDLDIAKRLIDISAAAGCNAVKFQKRNPDICVPEHQKNIDRDTPWGKMTYLEYKHKVEFQKKEYDEIDVYCKDKKISWSASPWDIDSLNFLSNYKLPFIKMASASITHLKLLKKACETGNKIIISTGMSTEEEIDKAVDVLKSNASDYAILHCNSSYPAPIEELNLSCIKTLKEKYNCQVGYSGHEFRLGTSVAAVYLGAEIIERHVTLDRTMWGSDHMSSVEPQGLFKLVSGIRELETSFGNGKIFVTESEEKVKDKLRQI